MIDVSVAFDKVVYIWFLKLYSIFLSGIQTMDDIGFILLFDECVVIYYFL